MSTSLSSRLNQLARLLYLNVFLRTYPFHSHSIAYLWRSCPSSTLVRTLGLGFQYIHRKRGLILKINNTIRRETLGLRCFKRWSTIVERVAGSGWAYTVDTWAFPRAFRVIWTSWSKRKSRKYLDVVVSVGFSFFVISAQEISSLQSI